MARNRARLPGLLANDAQRLASGVRVMLKEHYGIRDEKLTAFGLQPFRGRNKKTTTPGEPPVLPPPTA